MNTRFMNTKINFSDMVSIVTPNFAKGRVEKSTNLFEARLKFFEDLSGIDTFRDILGGKAIIKKIITNNY